MTRTYTMEGHDGDIAVYRNGVEICHLCGTELGGYGSPLCECECPTGPDGMHDWGPFTVGDRVVDQVCLECGVDTSQEVPS